MLTRQQQAARRTWTKALKSGTFKQGTERLRKRSAVTDEPHYCCLGVACVLFSKARWMPDQDDPQVDRIRGEIWYLPKNIAEKLGLTQDQMVTLGALNDFEHMTFPQIAEIVELGLIDDDKDKPAGLVARQYWNVKAIDETNL